jgi:hypothetical protein
MSSFRHDRKRLHGKAELTIKDIPTGGDEEKTIELKLVAVGKHQSEVVHGTITLKVKLELSLGGMKRENLGQILG